MNSLLNAVGLAVATGFGVGCLPKLLPLEKFNLPSRWTGAGLLGTLLGVGIVLIGFPVQYPRGTILLFVLTLLSIWSAGRAERIWQVKDDSRIICDEVVGFLWSVQMLPWVKLSFSQTIFTLCAAFLLFRIFDVLKLPFAGVQKLRGGWGIVLDDLLAGLSVNLILQIILRLFI